MNKTIVFVSLLAVFLMLMIPNVSAVEYNQVKEKQEVFIQNHIDDLQENLEKIDLHDFKESLNKSSLNIDVEGIKEKLENIPSLTSLFRSYSFLDDPGNGNDSNGPDDITDWIYLFIFIITSPVSLPLLIFDFIFWGIYSSLVAYICIMSFVFVILLLLSIFFWPQEGNEGFDLSEEMGILEFLNDIYNDFPFLFFPSKLIAEFIDYKDWDKDGR